MRSAGGALVLILGLAFLPVCQSWWWWPWGSNTPQTSSTKPTSSQEGTQSGCSSSSSCSEGFCKFPDTVCKGPGECTTKPEMCSADFNPVCGCDGKTYPNACNAYGKGVSIKSEGECGRRGLEMRVYDDKDAEEEMEPEKCMGIGAGSCPEGQFCMHAPGSCGLGGEEGICKPLPWMCPRIFQPVCGCDGRDYSNYCYAYSKGMSLMHEGGCDEAGIERGLRGSPV